MRKKGKTDANQVEMVKSLRSAGCSVWITSNCGNGAPDLVVGFHGKNFLLELKDPKQPPSKRRLTDDERAFRGGWLGAYAVVETFEEALIEIGA